MDDDHSDDTTQADDQPNILLIFTDDQGYGDLGCFGSPYIETPNVDQLATEGCRFTDFQAAPICTPSRAALMTGSYAARVGLGEGVLFPGDDEGLHPDEVTIADVPLDSRILNDLYREMASGRSSPVSPYRSRIRLVFWDPLQ